MKSTGLERANKFLEMQVFVAVVQAGSFVVAAERLSISKQAVSRHITALENRLQVRLLQRTTRKMSLTVEGQNFYLQAQQVLSALDETELSIHPEKAEPVGLVRVNVPTSFGVLYLAPLWQQFMDRYPKVDLFITLSDLVTDLVASGDDLAVRIGNLSSSSLVSRRIASTRLILCASPVYLKEYGEPDCLEDLSQHRIISYRHWSQKDSWIFMHQGQETTVNVMPRIFCNNGDSCRIMALQGGGIILQPGFIVGEDIKQGRLVEVLPDFKVPSLNIQAVYPSRKLLPLRVRVLVDFLIEQLQHEPWQL